MAKPRSKPSRLFPRAGRGEQRTTIPTRRLPSTHPVRVSMSRGLTIREHLARYLPTIGCTCDQVELDFNTDNAIQSVTVNTTMTARFYDNNKPRTNDRQLRRDPTSTVTAIIGLHRRRRRDHRTGNHGTEDPTNQHLDHDRMVLGIATDLPPSVPLSAPKGEGGYLATNIPPPHTPPHSRAGGQCGGVTVPCCQPGRQPLDG